MHVLCLYPIYWAVAKPWSVVLAINESEDGCERQRLRPAGRISLHIDFFFSSKNNSIMIIIIVRYYLLVVVKEGSRLAVTYLWFKP